VYPPPKKNATRAPPPARAAEGLHDARVDRAAEAIEEKEGRLSSLLSTRPTPKEASPRSSGGGLTVRGESDDLEKELRANLLRARASSAPTGNFSGVRAAGEGEAPEDTSVQPMADPASLLPDPSEPTTDELMALFLGLCRDQQEQDQENAESIKDATQGSSIPEVPASDGTESPGDDGSQETGDSDASAAAAAVRAAAKALAEKQANAAAKSSM
jgi:hypothetical protein